MYGNWEYLAQNTSNKSVRINTLSKKGQNADIASSLPAGEYDIWILADNAAWSYRNNVNYQMVKPIRIKIVDPNNPDCTYTSGDSGFMKVNGINQPQKLKLYYTRPDGTAVDGDESVDITGSIINKVIYVKPGTQVKVVAEYNNISTIKRVICSKFTIKPHSTT